MWCDKDDEEIVRGDVTYDAGEGLWVNAKSENDAFRSSGEVINGSVDVYLRAGAKMVNNPMPVAIPFNDDNKNGKFIAPSGYNYDTYEGGDINVQKLDKDGYTVKGSKFYWWDDEDGAMWCDKDDEEISGEVLQPGEAIWVNAKSTTEKLNFPAAL